MYIIYARGDNMTAEELKRIFSQNLKNIMERCGKTQKDIVDNFMNTYRYKSCKSNEYLYLDEFSKALSLHVKNRPETLRDRVLREIAKKL